MIFELFLIEGTERFYAKDRTCTFSKNFDFQFYLIPSLLCYVGF